MLRGRDPPNGAPCCSRQTHVSDDPSAHVTGWYAPDFCNPCKTPEASLETPGPMSDFIRFSPFADAEDAIEPCNNNETVILTVHK